jgi:Mg/Co/Ni transporter MgtE
MKAHGSDWIGVVDGDRLLGWTWMRALEGCSRIGDAPLDHFRARVTPDTPLRQVLDGIVKSRTRVAVVVDATDRYLGMITIDHLAEGIR